MGDCELLELKRSSLDEQAHRLASVMEALHDFTNERFLNNLTSTSPIFKPFPKSMRKEIIKKFKERQVKAGEVIIEEGKEGEGLFLLMKGQLKVEKKDSGELHQLAELKEGDVVGEIALIEDTPTTATCTMTADGTLVYLNKRDFKAVMARHPEMKDELKKITAERLKLYRPNVEH